MLSCQVRCWDSWVSEMDVKDKLSIVMILSINHRQIKAPHY